MIAQSSGAGASPFYGFGGRRCPTILLTMLNAKDWKIVFEIYEGHPMSAVDLARLLVQIRKALQQRRNGKAEAIAGIDLAIKELYPHTNFDSGSRKLFHRAIEGTLSFKQQEKLRELGVEF
jgi:hypothetical protein